MSITAEQVRELRERTGAGMMECKKALVATAGDLEKAVTEMRKTGQATAERKATRVAAEGVIAIHVRDNLAVMVEMNSETDFVARDQHFIALSDAVGEAALAQGVDTLSALMQVRLPNSEQTVEQARLALIGVVGENVVLRRMVRMQSAGVLGYYTHSGRIGVLVSLKGGDLALAKDIAMHIAASAPLFVSAEEIPKELIEKEKSVLIAQAQTSGKPQEIIEKMIAGRLNKFLEDLTLLGQPFVKNPDLKISQLLKEKGASVLQFVRFVRGEGIEKQSTDFAAEVMSQVQRA